MHRVLRATSVAILLVGCNHSTANSTATETSAAPATSASAPPVEPTAQPSASASASAAMPPSASASAGRPEPRCPPATSPERVASYDWAKELEVDPTMATRLRGVSGAAAEAHTLATQVEGELRAACAGLATSLGAHGAYTTAPIACQAAVDALHAARGKLGPGAKVTVNVHPAICPTPMAALQECTKRCNGDGHPAEATCAGSTVGRCPGTCDGMCEMRAPGQCDGQCAGRCDGVYAGNCDGTCKGTCNGVEMKQPGQCRGTCEGSCDGIVKGPCKGACKGGCQLKAAACAGVCTGRCSVALEEPKCAGPVRVTGTAECAASCELASMRRTPCGAAQVDVRVDGAKDAKAKTTYETALERNLPLLLKVEAELRDHMAAVGRAKTTVAAGLKAITESNSPMLPAVTPCLFGYDKASVEGINSLLSSYRSASDTVSAAKAR